MATSRAINTGVTGSIIQVAQNSHGFSVGMPITRSAGGWAQSNATSSILTCDAIVSVVADANNFTALFSGPITLTAGQWDAVTGDVGGLSDGDYYFLSTTVGHITKITPTVWYSQVLLKAINTTTAIVEINEAFSLSGTLNSLTTLAQLGIFTPWR